MLKQPPGMQSTCTGCVQYTIFTSSYKMYTSLVYMYCDLAHPTQTKVPLLFVVMCVCTCSISLCFPSSAKTITVCCLPPYCDCLFVGTLGGITYPMDTEFDGMSPEVLSWSRARA